MSEFRRSITELLYSDLNLRGLALRPKQLCHAQFMTGLKYQEYQLYGETSSEVDSIRIKIFLALYGHIKHNIWEYFNYEEISMIYEIKQIFLT